MQASKSIIAALCLSLGACAENHFAYVIDTGPRTDGGVTYQQVRLAKITDPSPPTGPAATDTATLLDTAIQDGNSDQVSNIEGLWASPGNLRLVALVDVVVSDRVDRDLNAWDMISGTPLTLVNELTVANSIHRSTCRSVAFDAFLASSPATQGTPQSVLDSDDFSVPTDTPQEQNDLPDPQVLGWLDDTHLLLSWRLPLYSVYNFVGPTVWDTFLVVVTWPVDGAAPTVACTSLRPPVPHPPTALSADPTIRLHGNPVKWTDHGRPIPAPQARFVAGVISP